MTSLLVNPTKEIFSTLYLGLMSGTSLDGVDGVLVDFGVTPFKIIGRASCAMPASLRTAFLTLQQSSNNEIHQEALAANALAALYAECVTQVLADARVKIDQVQALGAHGQTIRHQPHIHQLASEKTGKGWGYTRQVLASALLAELSGINVVSDFRSRDIAAGGQGAPLVPAFHAQIFASADEARVICNIGGIANLTILPAGCVQKTDQVIGFDCGPGNVLLDEGARTYLNQEYDDAGQWAASAQADASLLAQLMQEPFFHQAPPKSTGRDLFNSAWLKQHLLAAQSHGATLSPVVVQATLNACTAQAIAQAAEKYGGSARKLIVCGGGAHNLYLMTLLQSALPQWQVMSSMAMGMPAQDVEATAFAWLAWRFMHGLPGNLPSVTGADGLRVLGAYYPR